MSASTPSGRHVLLAEDSLVNQRLARSLLERQGHSVTIATTGREAVELAQSKTKTFDLILMDVQMPEMNGLDATRAIRQAEATAGGHIPIIAMTGNEMEGDRESCLAAGMDDYLAKPIRSQELAEKLQRHLAPGLSSTASITTAEPSATPSSNSSGIDWTAALAAVGGNRKLMADLVELYVQEGPRLLEQIRIALLARNLEGLRIAAHTLKGSSRYFGPNQIEQLSAELEQSAAQGDVSKAERVFQSLGNALPEFLPALNTFSV